MDLLVRRLNLSVDFYDYSNDYEYYTQGNVPLELVKNGTFDLDAWFYEKEPIYEKDFDFTIPVIYVSFCLCYFYSSFLRVQLNKRLMCLE